MIRSSSSFKQTLFALTLLALLTLTAYGADPGLPIPAGSEVSDQKVGSVLIFNLYLSSASGPNTQNTRFSITNTNNLALANVHLFFVDNSGLVTDSFICLTPVQTASFLASDVDPGVRGYAVAVAVDANGCPLSFNFLGGYATVKLSSGHEATLAAEAFSAQFSGSLPGCDANSVTAQLVFDASAAGYNRAPRMLAIEKLRSPGDGNSTQIVINRVGGNLLTGASTTGGLAGVLYDDLANQFTFTLTGGVQIFGTLSDSFPLTSPVFSQVITAGRTGWMKFYTPTSDFGLLGAVLNFNANAGASPGAFIGGHNMRKLTLSTTNTFTIPVFPPSC